MIGESERQAIVEGERIGSSYTLVPRRARMGTGGVRVGRRAGGSLEFRDHRDYQPGDDLRHLDWGIYARSDKLTVKQFSEEITPFVDLIVDGSRSMALVERKSAVALALAALFASSARATNVPYALSLARGSLDRIAVNEPPSQWRGLDFDFRGTPDGALVDSGALRPFSIRIVISDLLWPADATQVLHALSARASSVIVVQVLAREDATPDLRGGWRIVDCENGDAREVLFDDEAERRYRDTLMRHREAWDEAAKHSRAAVARCIAEDVGEGLVFDELAALDIVRPAWFRS